MSRSHLTDAEWRILNLVPRSRRARSSRCTLAVDDQWHSVGFCALVRRGTTCRNGTAIGTRSSCVCRAGSKLAVWDAAFETLPRLGPPADEERAIDSTIVRAHQHAADANGGM